MCSHEVCASNTRSRGASKTRVMTISRSEGVVTVSLLLPLSPIALPLSSTLELLQVPVQPVVALFPEPAIPLDPLRDIPERTSLEPGGPPLPLPAPGDQPGPLEDLQVLGDRRQAHLERRRQLGHRGLPSREPREDRPPRGIRQRRERPVQLVRRRSHSTSPLNNHSVKYRETKPTSSPSCRRWWSRRTVHPGSGVGRLAEQAHGPLLGKPERRVSVGDQSERVGDHPCAPPDDALDEIEHALRIPAGEQD